MSDKPIEVRVTLLEEKVAMVMELVERAVLLAEKTDKETKEINLILLKALRKAGFYEG